MVIGTIQTINIDDEMRSSYLDYAMSVIVARALPDARDGLKPVHRRILYAMMDMGIRANSSYKKSARIVGEVLGKYHPHGDVAVYDSMARLAQDFSMRYPLVDGQGNFGSIDGDPPAAMRYTEARLTRMSDELLADLNMNTVDWGDNFDGSLEEPTVLPSRLPNMLLNGASGIAVGMATNIPPHNLTELAGAIAYIIDNIDRVDDISVDELMQFVKGPDFPTGATILAGEALRETYATGRGKLIVRAKAEVEEFKNDRHRIVITEIPYQVNKTTLIEKIAELVKDGDKLNDISDLRDESDRRGMRIVIELRKNAQPKKVLNQLYKQTTMQSTFGVQLLALVDGEPKTINLKRCLTVYIDHRRVVIRRRSEFELAQNQARAHILEGYLIALTNIDAVIETIRRATDTDDARNALMTRFSLSEEQSKAILELQLRRIASLERLKIDEEYKGVRARIAYLEELLSDEYKILNVIKADLIDVSEKYGDRRRTEIDYFAMGDFHESDFVKDEEVLIALTRRGYIKRTASSQFRAQARGGKGVSGMTRREEDLIDQLVRSNSLDTLLFFTNQGRVYAMRTYELPETDRIGKGTLINTLVSLGPDEVVTAIAPVSKFESGSFVMCTMRGRIKRVRAEQFASVRTNGLIAMNIEDGDSLKWVKQSTGHDDILIVTRNGRALRFNETKIRLMGRTAGGVGAIRLREVSAGVRDQIVGMDIIGPDATEILVITELGYGKRSPITDYPVKGRNGQGVLTFSRTGLAKLGSIVSAHVAHTPHALIATDPASDPAVDPSLDDGTAVEPTADLSPTLETTVKGEEVAMISRLGMLVRTPIAEIRRVRRSGGGVRIFTLKKNDLIVSTAVVEASPDMPVETVDEYGNPIAVEVSLNGHSDGTLMPTDTTAEVVDILHDTLDEVEDAEDLTADLDDAGIEDEDLADEDDSDESDDDIDAVVDELDE